MQKWHFRGIGVYIKNLDICVDDELLRKEFSAFGTIISVKVMEEFGKSMGFGFVNFSTLKEANLAVKEMNGHYLGSLPIYVALAKRRETRIELINKHLASSNANKRQVSDTPSQKVLLPTEHAILSSDFPNHYDDGTRAINKPSPLNGNIYAQKVDIMANRNVINIELQRRYDKDQRYLKNSPDFVPMPELAYCPVDRFGCPILDSVSYINPKPVKERILLAEQEEKRARGGNTNTVLFTNNTLNKSLALNEHCMTRPENCDGSRYQVMTTTENNYMPINNLCQPVFPIRQFPARPQLPDIFEVFQSSSSTNTVLFTNNTLNKALPLNEHCMTRHENSDGSRSQVITTNENNYMPRNNLCQPVSRIRQSPVRQQLPDIFQFFPRDLVEELDLYPLINSLDKYCINDTNVSRPIQER